MLDNLATWAERLVALLTWQDPVATSLLVLSLLSCALLLWFMGVPALLACIVLVDIRPPVLRDPLPSPVEVVFRNLPSRRDQMM